MFRPPQPTDKVKRFDRTEPRLEPEEDSAQRIRKVASVVWNRLPPPVETPVKPSKGWTSSSTVIYLAVAAALLGAIVAAIVFAVR